MMFGVAFWLKAALMAAASAAIIGGYIWIRADAYNDGVAAANLAWGTKLAKAEAEWREAQKAAQEAAFREIDRLISEKETQDALLEQLRAEAAKDPGAASGGLGRDSVRRVGGVR